MKMLALISAYEGQNGRLYLSLSRPVGRMYWVQQAKGQWLYISYSSRTKGTASSPW